MTQAGRRLFPTLAAAVCCLLFGFVGTSDAALTFESSFGGSGEGAGKLSNPAAIGINTANGDLYVADRGNNRVEQFTSTGTFVRAWGYDVVASGPDDKPAVDEVDEVRIRATSGSFSLRFQGEETAQIPYNAGAGEVEGALNGLTTISSGGGSVSVTGGPGDATGSNPYKVTFDGGPLSKTKVELGLDPTGLGIAAGTQLSCLADTGESIFQGLHASAIEFQWLASGEPISGATSTTFTPGAAQEGKAVQCRVTAVFEAVKTVNVSHPYFIASPAPGTVPPLGPNLLATPEGSPVVGGLGGNTLKCAAGSWGHNPTTYTYQWYRNGAPIGSPTTTASTTDEYTLTKEDLEGKAFFQCAVTGTNAGGASTSFSQALATEPEPDGREVTVQAQLPPTSRSSVIVRTNGGPVFEVCNASVPTDVCKAGVAGAGMGQFNQLRSLAVDNSASGGHAVYLIDENNARVQKFDAEGNPILAFGKEVDETSQASVCTVASGDVCGPGVRATDSSPDGFGAWGGGFFEDPDLGNELAVDSAGHVYVGDQRNPPFGQVTTGPRVQKFDSNGVFLSQAVPQIIFAKAVPISVGVDSQERTYVSDAGEFGGVVRTGPSEYTASGEETVFKGNLFDTSHSPAQVAVDPRNDRILVSDRNARFSPSSVCGGPKTTNRGILEFDTEEHEIDCSVPSGPGVLPQATGMAVGVNGMLYVATGTNSLIKVYKLPVSAPPSISGESATEITTQTARLHGQINPGFENTTVTVEYGTQPCSTSTCATADGGVLRGLKTVDGSAPISGLQPDTTYYYRVTAENGLGPAVGTDRSFTTFPSVDLVNDPCPNSLARKQTKTVALLDCRAYELATAGFTGGYDVVSDLVPGQNPFDFYPDASGRLLYGVKDGGIPGTGSPTNRGIDPYLATRGDEGWSTKYVGVPADNPFATAPFSSTLLGASASLDTFAFGGPNICNHCFPDGSSGVPVRLPDGELTQGMAGSASHPDAQSEGYVAVPVSANGEHLIFGSTARFAAGGNEATGDVSIYDRNLKTGVTKVISNSPTSGATPEPLPCLQGAGQCHSPGDGSGIAELALSPDGRSAVLAQKVGDDAGGHPLWHLYLSVDDSVKTIDLTPGVTTGVYFDGMTDDGSKVFFTTADELLGEDSDESADIYVAEVSGGAASLKLVSVKSDGSPSNSDACTPPGTPITWNSQAGDGKCSAVAFADGAGMAAETGLFFFVTPEQLESGKGEAGQPNLYVVKPGEDPRFLATIDSSTPKPGPKPAARPLLKSNLIAPSEYFLGQGLAVDQATGNIYIDEPLSGVVNRFDSSGAPANFTAGPNIGSNSLTGSEWEFFHFSGAGMAVDNAPGAGLLSGALFVASKKVTIFAPSGEPLGALTGSGTNKGSFGEACGVAIDQSNGTVYVGDRNGFIWQYTPNSPSGTIDDTDYTTKGIAMPGARPCSLALDGAGHLYASNAPPAFIEPGGREPGGPVVRISTSSFATGNPPTNNGSEVTATGSSLAADPVTNELYVNEGNQIAVFDAAGKELTAYGQAQLAAEGNCGFVNSRGIAINLNTHHTYVTCAEPGHETVGILEYGYVPPPYVPIDNPGVVHGISQPGTHDYEDFQVTEDGRYAAFASTLPIKEGYDNALHREVYRYRTEDGALLCVSCSPTGSQAQSDSAMPSHGMGLLEDGRVFFNSGEQLTLSDTNGRLDAYEWSPEREALGGCKAPAGCQQLISTGNSASAAGLLGVSADGTDAFFFTRDELVPTDRNGQAMKIYDARESGGSFVIPPPPPCAASDECHGPSSQAAPPPSLGSLKGSGGQAGEQKPCKKGFVRKQGRCVKKPHHKHHKRHRGSRKGGGR